MTGYVCPDCRGPLRELHCAQCDRHFGEALGFPLLLSHDARFEAAREIVDAYESIYSQHSNVWENQGRSPEFLRYFAELLAEIPRRRLLEIGCGEGILLAQIAAAEKYGTDLSARALESAQRRAPVSLAVALAERLPFRDEYFDAVASVGVMEHFIDDRAACGEIFRVLAKGGYYVTLVHMRLSAWQAIQQKISEYLGPRPRPLALVKWLSGKLFNPIHQPIQNCYTPASARACLSEAGFDIVKQISKANAPSAPLIGGHVLIFVCRKPDGVTSG